MRVDGSFHAKYRELEERMKALAESEGDVFLPNTEPEGPVQYVLICMEPSLGRWARSADEARSKVEAGFRNFLFSMEDFILHFCARLHLCKPKDLQPVCRSHRGAMLIKRAGLARVFMTEGEPVVAGRDRPRRLSKCRHRHSWQSRFQASGATRLPKVLHSSNPLLRSSGTRAKRQDSRSRR